MDTTTHGSQKSVLRPVGPLDSDPERAADTHTGTTYRHPSAPSTPRVPLQRGALRVEPARTPTPRSTAAPPHPPAPTGGHFTVTPDELTRAAASYSAALNTLRDLAPLAEEPESADFNTPAAAEATRSYYLDARGRISTFDADATASAVTLSEAARAYAEQDHVIAQSLSTPTASPVPTTVADGPLGQLATLLTGGAVRPGLPPGPTTPGPPLNPAPPSTNSPGAMLNPYAHTPGLIDHVLNPWRYTITPPNTITPPTDRSDPNTAADTQGQGH
jgi:hypothetical protein